VGRGIGEGDAINQLCGDPRVGHSARPPQLRPQCLIQRLKIVLCPNKAWTLNELSRRDLTNRKDIQLWEFSIYISLIKGIVKGYPFIRLSVCIKICPLEH
jgi:hypothetical protein